MGSIHTELALYGSKNEFARTENVFSPYLRSAIVWLPLRMCRFRQAPLAKQFITNRPVCDWGTTP